MLSLARAVLDTERDALERLRDRLDHDFVHAVQHLLGCRGRVVITGMGKSGHIGGKIAATLASTGTASFFVHPGEASHGDLGMIQRDDVIVALSNSGETEEILKIVPLIRRLGVPLIAVTGNPASTLAREASVHLDAGVEREACPLGLAPTASTTAALAMGDALAVACLQARGFTAEDFARSHPGGRLGRRLLVHVGDVMRRDDAVPRIDQNASVADALLEITRAGLGFVVIVDADRSEETVSTATTRHSLQPLGRVAGVFTDGDLRRLIEQDLTLKTTPIAKVMTPNPVVAHSDWLAVTALETMERRRINALPVVDDGVLVGALNMHDLLRSGVA
ncbi:MAG: SIS domain-containing protein [Thioalkalivibrionaceae bacterium]